MSITPLFLLFSPATKSKKSFFLIVTTFNTSARCSLSLTIADELNLKARKILPYYCHFNLKKLLL